jgi:hypothetical protein
MRPGGATPPGFSLRTARIIWLCFLLAACSFIWIAHVMPQSRTPKPTPAPTFKWILAAVAVADILAIGAIRRNLLGQSQEKLGRGEATAARAGWSAALMLGFASAMSIVLFGFVLSILAPGWFGAIFYVAGLLLLVSYWPQLAE